MVGSVLLLSLWACSGEKTKQAEKRGQAETTCAQACEHLTSLAEAMVADLQGGGATVTRTGEDPQAKCVSECESGRLIPECAAAVGDMFTANLCSKKAGEEVNVAGVMFLVAASDGDVAGIQRILKEGLDVNYRRNGDTALGVAIVNGHVKIAQLLVAAKADVNFVTESTRVSLLQRAVIHERQEIVQILLDAGADLAHKDGAGTTALQNAAGQPAMLELLNGKGAN